MKKGKEEKVDKNKLDYWERYDKIAKSEWFQKAYKNKPLGSELEDSEFFFDAGYKAAKAEMMEKAFEGVMFQLEEYYPKELVAHYNGEMKHGDKVKILILDENE